MKAYRYVAPLDPLYDADGVQVTSGQDERGHELPDPVPMAPPVGYRASPTLAELIQRMVKSAMIQHAADVDDFDSFDEAEDFDIEDDPVDPRTPYEAVFDPKPETKNVPTTDAVPTPAPGGNGAGHSNGASGSNQPGATPPAPPAEGNPVTS